MLYVIVLSGELLIAMVKESHVRRGNSFAEGVFFIQDCHAHAQISFIMPTEERAIHKGRRSIDLGHNKVFELMVVFYVQTSPKTFLIGRCIIGIIGVQIFLGIVHDRVYEQVVCAASIAPLTHDGYKLTKLAT